MDIFELIKSRRSIRKYSDKKIEKQDLEKIVDAGIHAPSGQNKQPWYIVAIHSDEALLEVRKLFQALIPSLRKELERDIPDHKEVIEETVRFTDTMGNAQAVILVFLNRSYPSDVEMTMVESAAAAMQNMLLAAHALGISACWQTSVLNGQDLFIEKYAKDKGMMIGAITLGYNDQTHRELPRKEGRVAYL